MINRKELKEKVPYGYGKKIAEKAGVSQKVVSDYLNGKINSEKVEIATLEILAEISMKKKLLLEQIS